MKKSFKILSLSLLLAAPVTLSLPAQAQVSVDPGVQVLQQAQQQFPMLKLADAAVVEEATVAQMDDDAAWRAYSQSGYTYWDAQILANFWGDSVSNAKAMIGRKVSYGMQSKALLEQYMVDARVKALGNVEDLKFFFDAGYDYDDAAALATFWGDSSPYQTKLRIERNIILGNNDVVRRALRMAQDRG